MSPVRFFRHTHPSSLEVPTYSSLNLLAHAQLEELDIGSRCGGHGICGADRVQVKVIRGAVSQPNEIERKHLNASELAAGFRLGCQCYPENDDSEIEVRVPELNHPKP